MFPASKRRNSCSAEISSGAAKAWSAVDPPKHGDVRTEQQARLIWDVRNPKFVPATIIPALGVLYLASMILLLVLFPIPIGTMALITEFSKCKYAEPRETGPG